MSDLAAHLDGPCDNAALLVSLEALHDYADWHFTFEERLLERAKYPWQIDHVAEHRAIIDQINTLRDKLATGNVDMKRLIPVISHWIVDHVNNEDMRAVKYIEDVQTGTTQVKHRPKEGSLLL
ncbi:hemerythrin family protein [Dechloromonas sp. XY25]|uniref:Hemerythrin family protein n=1 Tax=Dechloromonas hankyongensis TaxID=2908002 RepID=A0ABS9K220_9RHOO|nr:hemerythrin family protein [Dechloromonas hankyongensis]